MVKERYMHDLKWKTLASEYLFKDLWFTVRKDTCLTPGGKLVNPYYVYEFPTWVTALPVTDEGKIILLRQFRQALGEVCIEIPGGCVDDNDENLETAIRRELLEETGYTFPGFEYLGKISANPSTNNNLMHMYLARGGKKTNDQKLDGNEEIEVMLYEPAEVIQLIKENKIMQAMHVTCMLYAFEKLGVLNF
jgi:ADP-ribose pyrophosphatase